MCDIMEHEKPGYRYHKNVERQTLWSNRVCVVCGACYRASRRDSKCCSARCRQRVSRRRRGRFGS